MNEVTVITALVLFLFASTCVEAESSCNTAEAQKAVAKNAKLNSQVTFEFSAIRQEIVITENGQARRIASKGLDPVWKDFVRIHKNGGCIYSMNSLPEESGPLAGFSGYMAFEQGQAPKYVLSSIR